jgi:esterase/lipase superfamily enzyme
MAAKKKASAAQPFLMISNRNIEGKKNQNGYGLGSSLGDTTVFFECPGDGDSSDLSTWTELTVDQFEERLKELAGNFGDFSDEENEKQQHVTLFVHGFNVSWEDAVARYSEIKHRLFDARNLGVLILYTWPSNGSPAGYLPDREDARDSAEPIAELFVQLHDHLSQQIRDAAEGNGELCRAKVSIIAHSMGNYVVEKALAVAAKRLNSPQLITLIHQLVMVAADVDNDLFQKDKPLDSDGSLMANLCYRIGALYTGLDPVLGASAGLKHFGTRRLGRSGLADANSVWDNVFDFDVSAYVKGDKNIHSAVFESTDALNLVEQILRGVDRKVLKRDQ